jgi:hypothetical protein
MAMLGATYAKLVTPGYRKAYFDEIKHCPLEYPKLFNILNSDKDHETDFEISGLGAAQEKPHAVAIQYDYPYQGSTKTYTMTTYALGFQIAKELFDDGLYGVGKKMSTKLARSIIHAMEVVAWGVLNNAFSTSYTGFKASTSLCTTSWTRLDGSAGLANRPSSDIDLTYSGLEAADRYFENVVDERGLPTPISPKYIVYGSRYKHEVKRILGSTLTPFSAENAINVFENELTPFLCHYFTDADQWFVTADKGTHDLNVFIREKPGFTNDYDFDHDVAKYKGRCRLDAGYGDRVAVYGSQGA